MNLQKIGIWEYRNKIGIWGTDNVFLYTSRLGRIETMRIDGEEEPRFVGHDWASVIKAIDNSNKLKEDVKSFKSILPDIVDAVEDFILSEEFEDSDDRFTWYVNETDEVKIYWHEVTIKVVYDSICDLEVIKKVNLNAGSVPIQMDEIRLAIGDRKEIDLHCFLISKEFIRQLDSLIVEGRIDFSST